MGGWGHFSHQPPTPALVLQTPAPAPPRLSTRPGVRAWLCADAVGLTWLSRVAAIRRGCLQASGTTSSRNGEKTSISYCT